MPFIRFRIRVHLNKIALINLQKHKSIRVLEENKELLEKVAALGLTQKEFIKLDIGEVVLDAWIITPPNFDPSKKYPYCVLCVW